MKTLEFSLDAWKIFNYAFHHFLLHGKICFGHKTCNPGLSSILKFQTIHNFIVLLNNFEY